MLLTEDLDLMSLNILQNQLMYLYFLYIKKYEILIYFAKFIHL